MTGVQTCALPIYPTAEESKLAVEFLAVAQETKPNAGQLTPAELLAQVLLISNEFAFVD